MITYNITNNFSQLGESEIRQISSSLLEWQDEILPPLQVARDNATAVWYKPKFDPIVKSLGDINLQVKKMRADFEIDLKSRPVLGLEKENVETSSSQMFMLQQERMNIVHFDAANLIGVKFNGDTDDPDILLKFNNWKSNWLSLLSEMETLPGCNMLSLFKKLKDCLEGNALHRASSIKSYDNAMQDLVNRFEDPIGLAGCYYREATNPNQDKFELADNILQSYSALNGMEDVFEREGVNMYHFSLIQAFVNTMPSDMRSDWNAYQVKKKEEYNQRVANSSNQDMAPWHAGQVINYATFTTWLKFFYAKRPKYSKAHSDAMPPISTGANFAISAAGKSFKPVNGCFICVGNNPDNHKLERCPVGQNMTYKSWLFTCKQAKLCGKCAKPYTPGHSKTCRVACINCRGKSYDNDHHILMCPMNRFRKFPPGPQKSSASQGRDRKRDREYDNSKDINNLTKLVGQVCKKLGDKSTNANKDGPSESKKKRFDNKYVKNSDDNNK